jgi:hypothetical protein
MSFPIPNSIGGLFFTVLGLAGIVGALVFFVRQLLWLRTTAVAEGVVVGADREERQGTSDSGAPTTDVFYYPRLTFRNAAGAEVTFKSDTGTTGNSPYATGEKLRVRYQADRPEEAEIDGFWENWLAVVALGGMGLCSLLVGLGTMADGAAR